MVRVEAEGVVVGPRSRRETVLRRRVAASVLGVVAVKIADARLRLVVDGKRPDRHRVDVEVELGETRNSGIEVVQRARHARTHRQPALVVLPRKLVGIVGGKLIALVHRRLPEEVVVEVRVAVVDRLEPEHVTLGQLGAVLDAQAVAIAVDLVAPVAVVPLVHVVPVAVVAVGVAIPRVIDLELALAPVAETPPHGLPERHAVLLPQVEARAADKSVRTFGHAAADAVDVFRKERRPPSRRISRHHAPAVVGIHRIVPVWKPQHGHIPHPEPRVAEQDVVSLAETHLARHAPVEMVPVVGTRREVGRISEQKLALGVSGHRVGPQGNGRGDGPHVASGGKRAGHVVGGDAVGGDPGFAGRFSEKRCG